MEIRLKNLYEQAGHDIKQKMRKGEHVVISFENITALGESTVNDLQEFVDLPNVEVVDTTRYIDGQLGIEEEQSVSQLALF